MSASIYFAEMCRLFICLALVVASVSKVSTFTLFKDDLVTSFNIKAQYSGWVTVSIILTEGLLGIVILFNGPYTAYAMLAALLLFSVFTLVLWISLLQNKLIRCNCFGQSKENISYFDVSRNLLFILAGAYYLTCVGVQPLTTSNQMLLAAMATISFLISTHLTEIALINLDPKAN